MRVIAGRFKGRQLVDFEAQHIRPTTDRVKETLFNILQNEIQGARVLDLFSGTGNLAIESLSRGATHIEAVESHKTSLRIMRDNFKKLNIEKEIKISAVDVFKYVKNYKGEAFQLIFIDPPFTEAIAHDCMEAVSASSVAAEDTIIVIESSRKERIEDQYNSFHLLDRREFGDKRASFYKKV